MGVAFLRIEEAYEKEKQQDEPHEKVLSFFNIEFLRPKTAHKRITEVSANSILSQT